MLLSAALTETRTCSASGEISGRTLSPFREGTIVRILQKLSFLYAHARVYVLKNRKFLNVLGTLVKVYDEFNIKENNNIKIIKDEK